MSTIAAVKVSFSLRMQYMSIKLGENYKHASPLLISQRRYEQIAATSTNTEQAQTFF
jgi:hypothetical protein